MQPTPRSTTFVFSISIAAILFVALLLAPSAEARSSTITRTIDEQSVTRASAVVTRSIERPRTQPESVARPAVRTRYEPSAGVYQPEATIITLRDLGLLQLAAHDLFDVDRETEIDRENGLLDLSTLLHHGEENIALGGEPRNRENAFIFTVAATYGEAYLRYLERGFTPEQAYERTLKQYLDDLARVYELTFGEPVPTPQVGEVTMTENVALRTIHDLLPGTMVVAGKTMSVIDPTLIGTKLTDKELAQPSAVLDGTIDEAFLDVTIIIPPDMVLEIDLMERDSSFAEQFQTEHSFEYFLSELTDGSYDTDDDVMHYIRDLFAKAWPHAQLD